MNHVPEAWMRWIRRVFFVYGVHYLVGYIYVVVVLGKGVGVSDGAYTLATASVAILYVIYELCAMVWLNKRYPAVAALIDMGFILILGFIAGEATGVYKSAYFWDAIPIAFFAAALGDIYAPIAIVFILVSGLLLGVIGAFKTPTDLPYGLGIIFLTTVSGIGGWFFWRRYYVPKPGNDKATKQLNATLEDEKQRSEIILNSIEDGVCLVDAKGVIRVFNPGATNVSGWKASEAVGLDYHVVFKLVNAKNEPYTEDQDPFKKVFETKKTVRDNQAVLSLRSNKTVSINISVSPLADEVTGILGVVAVFRDVSAERTEEEHRAEFISTASHEMRTPVAAIEGYLSLALNDRVSKIDSKAREYLEKAHESTEHLGSLFQDLLTSSKAEDGRLSNHPAVVEMGDYLEDLAEDLRFAAEKKGLQMEFVVGAPNDLINAAGKTAGKKVVRPQYQVYVDPERLREVITNLFDNAVKYTETGTVSIGLTGNNEVVQLYIRDTGPGIPTEDIPHLFQKFYRVDNSATRTIGGTGLGLFIARKIVELYGGRIWVESEFGHGSTFFINLPRLSSQKAAQLQNATVATADPIPTVKTT